MSPARPAKPLPAKPDEEVLASSAAQPEGPTERAKSPRTIQALDRALSLLNILGEASSELTLGEIAARSGLNASTCHHLLATMAARGFIARSTRTRCYFLGPRINELAQLRRKQFNLVDVAMPELRRLNEVTLESVHLAVLQGHTLVTLAKLDSRLPIRVGSDDSAKADAAHATATGKAILAWLPETEIARVIAETRLHGFTSKTITSIAELMEHLRLVRRRGYAVDDEEYQPGVVCTGAAIRDHTGGVIGSVSCSMPRIRAADDQLAKVRAAVRKCASAISQRLGSPER